jgi:hypothetical protein
VSDPIERAGGPSPEEAEASFAAADAREALVKEMKNAGFARPEGVQNGAQAILRDIHTIKELFQPRAEFEGHIKDLMSALKTQGDLDPILVGWTGKRAVLIEGHHRHTTYKRAGYAAKPVAVEWFEGTIDEAVHASITANSKHKLPMTMQERLNAAWRLVRLGCGSKAKTAKSAGISERQVATMRSVLAKHREEVVGVEAWAKASKIAAGRGTIERSEADQEEWLQQLAKGYEEKIRRACGPKLALNPDMLARVLGLYCGNNLSIVFRSAGQQGLLEIDDYGEEKSDF